jgi:hypothetical protein
MTSTTKVHENLSLESLPNEIWKDIPDYEGLYQVSSLGRVKSLDRFIPFNGKPRKHKGKVLAQRYYPKRYFDVALWNIKEKRYSVHQLVAMAFLGHKPCGFDKVVDHINGDRYDNRIENLQITTTRHNVSKDKKGGTSKYIGVSRDRNKWVSSIKVNQKNIHLGRFDCEKEASKYYQNALKAIENGTEIKIKKPKYSSNHTGVVFQKRIGKWTSCVHGNKKTKHIGTFNTEEDAYLARQEYLKSLGREVSKR